MAEWSSGQLYRMELRTRAGQLVAPVPFSNLQGEFYAANKADQVRWEFPLIHPKMTSTNLQAGLTEMWLYRKNVQIFAGPIWDVTASSENGRIKCTAEGLESYFEERFVNATSGGTTYNSDQGEMGWTWINDSQALPDGSLNIVKGTVQLSTTRTVPIEYQSGRDIFAEINKMAELDTGFDWKILPATRAYTVWSPRRSGASTAKLEYPKTIKRYTVQQMGKWVANSVLIQGQNDNNIVATDPTSRAKYGLREYSESATDLPDVPAITARANYVRNSRAEPRTVPNASISSALVNPFESNSGIVLGGTVGLKIIEGITNLNTSMRLVGYQLTLGKQQNETFVLYFNDQWEL